MKPGTLPSGDRWLSVPPVVRLEGQRCGALGGGSFEGGVCDSLSHTASSVSDSHHPGFVLSLVCQGEGFGRGDSGSSLQGSGGACASNSMLFQLGPGQKPHRTKPRGTKTRQNFLKVKNNTKAI